MFSFWNFGIVALVVLRHRKSTAFSHISWGIWVFYASKRGDPSFVEKTLPHGDWGGLSSFGRRIRSLRMTVGGEGHSEHKRRISSFTYFVFFVIPECIYRGSRPFTFIFFCILEWQNCHFYPTYIYGGFIFFCYLFRHSRGSGNPDSAFKNLFLFSFLFLDFYNYRFNL